MSRHNGANRPLPMLSSCLLLFCSLLVILPSSQAASFPFEGCGMLVQGVECAFFQPDQYPLLRLYIWNLGGFHAGDHVWVSGDIIFGCWTMCMEGDGCIDVDVIRNCAPSMNPEESTTTIPDLAVLWLAPNPSTGEIRFEIQVPRPMQLSLKVLDLQGRTVGQVFEGALSAGRQTLAWESGTNGRHQLARGIYYLRLDSEAGHSCRAFAIVH